jgi:hypothetical protein
MDRLYRIVKNTSVFCIHTHPRSPYEFRNGRVYSDCDVTTNFRPDLWIGELASHKDIAGMYEDHVSYMLLASNGLVFEYSIEDDSLFRNMYNDIASIKLFEERYNENLFWNSYVNWRRTTWDTAAHAAAGRTWYEIKAGREFLRHYGIDLDVTPLADMIQWLRDDLQDQDKNAYETI